MPKRESNSNELMHSLSRNLLIKLKNGGSNINSIKNGRTKVNLTIKAFGQKLKSNKKINFLMKIRRLGG
jgi:hypothetical protein